MSIIVRKAVPSDGAVILSLVDSLAAYEKLPPPDGGARERLLGDLFSARPRLECYIAESGSSPAGYAFVLETYSSFLALPTLYLEDLFVLPEFRGKRAGYELFTAVVREAQRRGCGRMEWTVLDWNELAIKFYRRSGARHMKEWHLYRLVREDMEKILGGTNRTSPPRNDPV
ncbi:MAG TPA: GNAT family N-acetyltransferase [Bacteroidota bacterium]|nr:GNAT family N-acetyltransferase [Bacteroidota bacterium]